MYHVTAAGRLGGVLADGLRAELGDQPERGLVWLFGDRESAEAAFDIGWPTSPGAEDFFTTDVVVLEIDVTGLDVIEDPDTPCDGVYCTPSPIAASRLRALSRPR
jgi:hypothetical protein